MQRKHISHRHLAPVRRWPILESRGVLSRTGVGEAPSRWGRPTCSHAALDKSLPPLLTLYWPLIPPGLGCAPTLQAVGQTLRLLWVPAAPAGTVCRNLPLSAPHVSPVPLAPTRTAASGRQSLVPP